MESGSGELCPKMLSSKHGQANDPGARNHAVQGRRGLHAVQHRHAQVQYDQIGDPLPRFCDGSLAVASLAAGFEGRGPIDELANRAAHRSAVTYNEDSRCQGRPHAEETTSIYYLGQCDFLRIFVYPVQILQPISRPTDTNRLSSILTQGTYRLGDKPG